MNEWMNKHKATTVRFNYLFFKQSIDLVHCKKFFHKL